MNMNLLIICHTLTWQILFVGSKHPGYGFNVSTPKFMLNFNPQSAVLSDTFRWLGHESSALMDGINAS